MPLDPGTGSRQRPKPPSTPKIRDSRTVSTVNEEIASRQRLLRAKGYRIVVDGIWGAASQSAWSQYQASRRPAAIKSPPKISPATSKANDRAERQHHLKLARTAQAAAFKQARLAQERSKALALEARTAATAAIKVTSAQRLIESARKKPTTSLLLANDPATRRRVRNIALGDIEAAEEFSRAAKFAHAARAKAPEQMSARELVATTVDPITGTLDVRNPDVKDVTRVQRWLVSRGHKVPLDGKWTPHTFAALKAALLAFEKEEQKKARDAVVEAFYDTGLIVPGRAGFPLLGKSPTPGELLALLQGRDSEGDKVRGSNFTASHILVELAKMAKRSPSSFLHFKEARITELENSLAARSGGVDIFKGSRAFAGSSSLVGRQLALQARAMVLPGTSERERDSLVEQIGALGASRSANDFSRRIDAIKSRQEAEFKAEQMKQLAGRSWWQSGLHYLALPGEVFRRELVESWLWAEDVPRGIGSAVEDFANYHAGTQFDFIGAPRTTEEIERQAKILLDTFEKEHFWANLAFEVIADPLWLLPGVGWVGNASSKSALALEKVGFAVLNGERVLRASHLAAPLEDLFRVTAGKTLLTPIAVVREAVIAGDVAKGALLTAEHPLGFAIVKAQRGVQLATQTAEVAVSKAMLSSVGMMRRGFQPFTRRGAALGAGQTDHIPIPSDLQKLVDVNEREMMEDFERLAPSIIKTWSRDGESVFADDTLELESEFGGQIQANFAEKFRVSLSQKEAISGYKETFHNLYSNSPVATQWEVALGEAGLTRSEYRALKRKEKSELTEAEAKKLVVFNGKADAKVTLDDGSQMSLRRAHAQRLAQIEVASRKVYVRTMRDHGNWWLGSGDPEITRLLDGQVDAALDRLMNALLPAIQRRLAEIAEAKALLDPEGLVKGLYDEEGKYALRNSAKDQLRRKILADSFKDDGATLSVVNRRHTDYDGNLRTHSWTDKRELIDADVKREAGRLRRRQARQAAADQPYGIEVALTRYRAKLEKRWLRADAYLDDLAKRAADDVEDMALQTQKSAALSALSLRTPNELTTLWVDTATHVDVPMIYAREAASVWDSMVRGPSAILSDADLPDDIRELLAVVGQPAEIVDTAFERDANRLTYFLTGRNIRHEETEAGWRTSDVFRGMEPEDFEIDSAIRGVSAEDTGIMQMGASWQAKFNLYSEALAAGHDYVLPRAMRKQFAWWQAMAEAKGAPLKHSYNAMSAMLDVWTTLTLPGRPGFLVRNVVDNTAKMLVAGARDPRFYFIGAEKPGAGARSVFELGLREMRFMLTLAGKYQGNPVARYFEEIMESFWQHSSSVLSDIFQAHGIPVGKEAIDGYRTQASLTQTRRVPRPYLRDPESEIAEQIVRNPAAVLWDFRRDQLWDLMASRPENYAKRALYRSTYTKTIKAGGSEQEAMEAGLEKIAHTLYDYSKLTTLEDNFRFIFPFAFFWRKTMKFWGTEALDKPYLPAQLVLAEDRLRNELHKDWPEWMRRYVDANPITDVVSRVPGLSWLVPHMADHDVMFDPANFLSFNVLYRTFKGENLDLPPDKAGVKFLAPFVDALNDFGLSMNPVFRKPLEVAGVFNFRAWQSIFPQTSLIEGFSREFMQEQFPDGFNLEAVIEDKYLDILGSDFSVAEKIAERFDFFVQSEIARQELAGERVSRPVAEQKIRAMFYAQTVMSYFTGLYTRSMDPKTQRLYMIAEELFKGELDYTDLTEREKNAYQIFKRRKLPAYEFDQYLDALPAIHGYYSFEGDYAAAQAYKQRNPQIIQYVDPAWKGQPFGGVASKAALIMDTDAAMGLFDLIEKVDIPYDIRQLAVAAFVTPDLKKFWAKNDTPKRARDEMVKGQFFRHVKDLQDSYFAIPETDYDARDGFLNAHPILGHWWNLNNSRSDDVKAIINGTNAALRERYFEFVDGKDWDGARDFLHQFPFIFQFTKAEDRVSAQGDWIGGGKGKSQKARDYLAAKASLDFYFSLAEDARKAWLAAGGADARIVLAYFRKYANGGGGRSQHARDYLAAKSSLEIFFALLKKDKDRANAWLDGDTEQAKIVRAYFDKYASKGGKTQHARDYVAAKTELKHYFALLKSDKAAAKLWLKSGSKDALTVLAYFKKYGKMNKMARKWGKLVKSLNPEIQSRLDFWQAYWQLTPDERPSYVANHAEAAGVFVYGVFGDEERAASEKAYLRETMRHKLNRKSALYLRIKPLLDLYYTLDKSSDKDLFMRANPEVQRYLDEFAAPPTTGNKQLDKLIALYFSHPRRSAERTRLLEQNSVLQDHFDKNSSPADRAMHNLLEVYFKFEEGSARKKFAAQHPEISAYFEKRRRERDNEIAQASAFDLVDPRLDELRAFSEGSTIIPARIMQRALRGGVADNRFGDEIETSRERKRTLS